MAPAFALPTAFPILQSRPPTPPGTTRSLPRMASAPHERPRVVVIGAGLAGLSVSVGLADLGCSVDLLERRPAFTAPGSAFALRPNGHRALTEIAPDAVPAIEDAGIALPPGKGHLLLWGDVRDALLAAVRRRDGIRLRMGVEVEGIEEAGKAEVSIRTGGRLEVLPARLVLACDGVNSGVRKMLGRKAAKSSWATTWRGTVRVPDGSALAPLLEKGILPIGVCTLSRGWFCILFNFHSSAPGMMTWAVSTVEDVSCDCDLWAALEPNFTVESERDVLKEVFALASPDQLTHQADMRVINPADEEGGGWGGRGRIALMGGAAHAMCPASGLGGSMAFEDGVALCRIVRNLRGEKIGEDTVARFEAERLPRVAKIWDVEWKLTENNYMSEGKPFDLSSEYLDWVRAGI